MTDSEADRREAAEPPEGQPNREREGPRAEEPVSQTPPGGEEPPEEDEDARVDRDVEETFPASDPPSNY